MRVLLIHKFFFIKGGGDRYFFEIKRLLEERGHEVACFSTVDANNRESEQASYFVRAPEFRSKSLLKRISSIIKIIYSFEAKKKISSLIADFKPEIVHAFGIHSHLSPSVLDACRQAEVPVVMSCNDYKHICPNYKLFHHGSICMDCRGKRFYKAVVNRCCQESLQFSVASSIEAYIHDLFNLVMKNVHTFLFTSDFMAKTTEEFLGKDTIRWRKLGNPFQSSDYKRSEVYGNYILYFGRLVEEKGVDILLQAMALNRHVKLKIVGDGPQEMHLKELAVALKLNNVEFVGPYWGDELMEILMNCRFVVVPSIWHENFPYVILQAFAVGKAVVGTDRGGIPELVRNGVNGLISIGGNPVSLASCIKSLWESEELVHRMGMAAKELCDAEFSDKKMYDDLINVYKEVLG